MTPAALVSRETASTLARDTERPWSSFGRSGAVPRARCGPPCGMSVRRSRRDSGVYFPPFSIPCGIDP